jgi:hypothetical protein
MSCSDLADKLALSSQFQYPFLAFRHSHDFDAVHQERPLRSDTLKKFRSVRTGGQSDTVCLRDYLETHSTEKGKANDESIYLTVAAWRVLEFHDHIQSLTAISAQTKRNQI